MATGTDKASAQTMGAKAWGLLCMDRLGLPVPPAFVIGTQHCANNNTGAKGAGKPHPPAASPPFWQAGLPALEHASGLALGDARRPLLLSVRSGAAVSMPGMM